MKEGRPAEPDDSQLDLARQIFKALTKQLETVKGALEIGGADAARATGRLMELANMPDLAAEGYAEAVRLDPLSSQSRGMLVLALLKAKRFDEGLEEATNLAGQDPKFAMETLLPGERISALALLGDAFAIQGKLESAEHAYRTALERNAKDGYASGRLSQLLLQKQGRSQTAVQEAVTLAKNTDRNPRFRDIRSVTRLAESAPAVVAGISLSPIESILSVAMPGRPFVVAGDRRRASTERAESWSAELAPDLDDLDAAQKAQLGEHWSSMGREEHAGVGSFSRFVLQLLALGAPAELVKEATQGMDDEIEHAKLCFGIASAALGETVGIGAIEIENCLEGSSDPWTILHDTVVEGCVGETVSAAIAVEARRQCTNQCIATVLDKIVADESRHADLAWIFSGWMLQNHPDLADRVSALFSEGRTVLARRTEPVSNEGWDAALDGFGAVSPRVTQQVTRMAFFNDVIPRSQALLGAVA